mmetsp:Transcript_35110/g.92465  ORF Transcript_35110/g.92465 Transcript_35110/m.92465 type:complete len:87 (-) Transcript_35110:663-923(-)
MKGGRWMEGIGKRQMNGCTKGFRRAPEGQERVPVPSSRLSEPEFLLKTIKYSKVPAKTFFAFHVVVLKIVIFHWDLRGLMIGCSIR